ncbi:DUF3465 domain-containing protein [Thalassotalea fonticola]|uniref:DUF3465 domain-containing protein n=1 Tax=Thalassotalea fonticola TaxID=3065649 RepID=A0ABZ0GKA2_9GAMM|nr:DUF3465 domain-containing protein [Colwelliaceae bacterium S1-1]
MKNILFALLALIAGLIYLDQFAPGKASTTKPDQVVLLTESNSSDDFLANAFDEEFEFERSVDLSKLSDVEKISHLFQNQLSNVQVRGFGRVVRMLPDDNEGSRHQRFIVRLKNNQTVLVAHNIDIGSRVNSLREGDDIGFYGVYEWNDKGGVVHWTHKDPNGQHPDGYLKYVGLKYH